MSAALLFVLLMLSFAYWRAVVSTVLAGAVLLMVIGIVFLAQQGHLLTGQPPMSP